MAYHRRSGPANDAELGIAHSTSQDSSMSSSKGRPGVGGGDGINEKKTSYEEHELRQFDSIAPGQMTEAPEEDGGSTLHRGLKARHISMIAIGGAIGTGLIINTGQALADAGPGSVFISYLVVGLDVFLVMSALGEMAAWLPAASNFAGYATRYVDPALGFSVGWTYWFKYIINTPNQITAGALVIQAWLPPSKVSPGVWIAIFLVAILAINYFGIGFFGELEFWFSSIKVLVILGVIILSVILAAGGGPNHQATGFTYWQNPGAFKPYAGITDPNTAKFAAFWSTLVAATYAYLGTELIGITVGEAQNPRRSVPRAIKLTFFRILLFYVVSVFLLGMLVPYNSRELVFATKASTSAEASPFVVAVKLAGIPVLPGFLNACILIFVFSAANSDLYIASRTLYGLARQGKAPRVFTWTDGRGVPVPALGLSAAFGLLAFMAVSSGAQTVFGYFVSLVTVFGMLTWISILVTHIQFAAACKAQGITHLPYHAPFGVAGSWVALVFTCVMTVFKGFTAFIPTFDYKNFIVGYLGVPLYLILIAGYKWHTRCRRVPADQADLHTGKARIDAEEEAFLQAKAEREASLTGWKATWNRVYKKSIGLVF